MAAAKEYIQAELVRLSYSAIVEGLGGFVPPAVVVVVAVAMVVADPDVIRTAAECYNLPKVRCLVYCTVVDPHGSIYR